MNPTKIQYISSNTIRPVSRTESIPRVDLTPFDIILLRLQYMQGGLLFRKPQTQEAPALINRLRTSLSCTLDYFVPLTGRLTTETHQDNNTTTFYIDCSGAGAEFIHATIDVTVSDIIDPLYVPNIIDSFFPLNGMINYEGISQPLLALQVTELVDGIFIGCSMNHVVCDGRSFWHFMNSWAEMARTTTSHHTLSRSPILKRWFLNDTDSPIRIPSSIVEQIVEEGYNPPLPVLRFFNFTQESMAKLKAKANTEQSTDKISSLQALLGHVWRALTRARCVDCDQEVICEIVVGNGARLNPPLPEEYFGNSGQGVKAIAKAGELLDKGLGWAAWLLNQAVTSHDETKIRKSLDDWVKEPFLLPLSKTDANIMSVWGSPRFDVYGNDFGWGHAIALRNGCANRYDGRIAVQPGAVQGSVDIEVCVLPQTLKAMGDDPEFMEDVNAPISIV